MKQRNRRPQMKQRNRRPQMKMLPTEQIQEEPSAEMLAEDTVIYTNMRGKRKPPVKPLKPESTKHSVSFPKRGCRRTDPTNLYINISHHHTS
ncbi:hypothetical protein D4764_0229430 [Takifugu flavidus]|uniref:Uncharacterized protein n=1 Tax=Takifugu flavidus TaxID=433684 RepID=A0A5C6MDI1_9TELE|nr:hypothetical protein D4764_0229430 [Takifugu flavidus]